MQITAISFKSADGSFAKEGVDVDLRSLSDEEFNRIENEFNETGVLVFRSQSLTPQDLIEFSKLFGEVEKHLRQEFSLEGFSEIHVLSNIKQGERTIGSAYAGDAWHADLCFKKAPSRMSILYSLEIPHDANGKPLGDTLFASAADAYDRLSDSQKNRIADLRGIMQYNRRQEIKRQERAKDHPRPPLTEEQKAKTPDITQPVVRLHPLSKRKCIYVNETYTFGIEGMPEEEAKTLLDELQNEVIVPDRIYRHKWKVGDVIMWDNCLTQHKAIGDYKLPQRRKLLRTSISGAPVE